MAESSLENIQRPDEQPEVSAVTHQPGRANELTQLLDAMPLAEVSEASGARPSENWAGSSTGGTAQATDDDAASARSFAIANLPEPKIMQKKLQSHIKDEIRTLRKEARKIVRLNKPGAAYKLNELYAKIRHLNSLMSSLLEASYEVLKRIFIRVFIDKQSIVTK